MLMTVVTTTFIFFSIYMLGSLSGIFAERSGTINLAINGGMIIGALTYFLMIRSFLSLEPQEHYSYIKKLEVWMILVSFLVAIIFSVLFTSFLSIAAINIKGDQIIVGTALNILAPIISLIALEALVEDSYITANSLRLSELFQSSLIEPWVIYMIIAIIVIIISILCWIVINKTTFGLRLRSAGENPNSLAASGVSVYKIRHIAMIISGSFSGLAGALAASISPKMSAYFNNVSGIGFISLAIMILGQWRTPFIVIGAIFISFLFGVGEAYGVTLVEKKWLLYAIPYLGTILILPLISWTSSTPKSIGIPYNKSIR